MHIVNGTLGSGHEYATELTKLMEEILTTLKYTLQVNFNEQDIYFQRFITHLKFFLPKEYFLIQKVMKALMKIYSF